ncbi:hypothetical protein CO038_00255 [Candidatus Pacearchaeota archaeon CG_4_9_14_0_2_um_filter_39_13]|nr:hypothetical protein [Candidatus Pacearchaeota archaeon]PJC45106.1 MAG: hypothetical protein CO038_00255 [Candidatus Pacearchaeota archaeon CG_4_9_14_0_2_um_filter_39_13]
MFGSNSCIICEDSISDPTCRSCYIKQVNILLKSSKVRSITRDDALRKIKHKFPPETMNITECILCRKENVAMCRYCFSIILRDILIDLNFTEDLIEEFGFNLAHEEVSLEREIRLRPRIVL